MPKIEGLKEVRIEHGSGFANPAALGALARGDLANFLVAATPGGIEAQEKAGQVALVNSTNMPIEMSPNQEAFEKVGFIFGERIDELFCKATLPAGWTRATTEHDMHSKILDEQGRERVSIFYKAAFYDRRADSNLLPRYRPAMFYGDSTYTVVEGLAKDQNRIVILDAGKEIHRFPDIKSGDYAAQDAGFASARAWLEEHFPLYRDPTAHWSEA